MISKLHSNKPKPLAVSVIVPLYNEQKSIPEVLTKIQQALIDIPHEVILVDDGSVDGTEEVVTKMLKDNHKLIVLEGNHGQSVALLAGFENSRYDLIVVMDGDGQVDPNDIVRMYGLFVEGDSELIHGVRHSRRDPFFKKGVSLVANAMVRQILGSDILDAGCPMKIFKRSILNGFPYFNGYHRLFPVVAQKIGIKVSQVPINHSPRKHGTSNYGIGRTLHVLRHVWALSSNPMAMRENLSYKVKNIVQGT